MPFFIYILISTYAYSTICMFIDIKMISISTYITLSVCPSSYIIQYTNIGNDTSGTNTSTSPNLYFLKRTSQLSLSNNLVSWYHHQQVNCFRGVLLLFSRRCRFYLHGYLLVSILFASVSFSSTPCRCLFLFLAQHINFFVDVNLHLSCFFLFPPLTSIIFKPLSSSGGGIR